MPYSHLGCFWLDENWFSKNIFYIYRVFGVTEIVGQSKFFFLLNVNRDTSAKNGLHL